MAEKVQKRIQMTWILEEKLIEDQVDKYTEIFWKRWKNDKTT